ncbi:MAG TPA: hypothetical protein VES89_09660 [Candidatus Competibacteraceae bacterium]|nr:hypothetical protein [Candidatus Competibacteraceae bacterium]
MTQARPPSPAWWCCRGLPSPERGRHLPINASEVHQVQQIRTIDELPGGIPIAPVPLEGDPPIEKLPVVRLEGVERFQYLDSLFRFSGGCP